VFPGITIRASLAAKTGSFTTLPSPPQVVQAIDDLRERAASYGLPRGMRPTGKRRIEADGIQPALLCRARDAAAFSRATSFVIAGTSPFGTTITVQLRLRKTASSLDQVVIL